MEGFVNNNGVKLHYISPNFNEKKDLTLLFVPGVMMPAWIWDNQLEYFSKNYRVIAMEPRSQGDSDQATEGHYSYAIAKDIKALVDQLEIGPFVLIGWSLGVPEVVNYAALLSDNNLKGLVLVDGLAGMDPSLPFYKKTVELWTELQFDRAKKTQDFLNIIFKKPQTDEFIQKLFRSSMKTPTNTVMTLMLNYILQDYRHLLPKISVPTFIFTIDNYRIEYMKNMQKLIPSAKLEIIDDAGHALFIDQPDVFNKRLLDFISHHLSNSDKALGFKSIER